MKVFFLFFTVVFLNQVFSQKQPEQTLSAQEVLAKSIAYHDPLGRWNGLVATFEVEMETPSRPTRTTLIELNFPKEYFKSTVTTYGITTASAIEKGNCTHWFEGNTVFTDEIAETHRLNCERTTTMRNYYTYLYGLPMKLNDPGTHLDQKVYTKVFNGESLLCLKVTYAEAIGKDSWYFYFDPATFALRHYQFYHDESKNDGEYILLSGEETVQGIKMPKTRAWYTNQANEYLGTDVLSLLKEE